MDEPWTQSPDEILQYYSVDPARGLSTDLAAKHAELYGKNGTSPCRTIVGYDIHVKPPSELPEEPPTPLWELILEQFQDQLVLILLASAVISFVLALFEESDGASWWSAFVEPVVILLILVANATVGVIQETNAEKAIEVSVLAMIDSVGRLSSKIIIGLEGVLSRRSKGLPQWQGHSHPCLGIGTWRHHLGRCGRQGPCGLSLAVDFFHKPSH